MTTNVYISVLAEFDLGLPFIRAHIERLPANVIQVSGYLPSIDGTTVLSQSYFARGIRKLKRAMHGQAWDAEITDGYVKAFSGDRAIVLAEFGPNGVRVVDACDKLQIPLVVHFHGYDASGHDCLREMSRGYQQLFDKAAAVIVVSRAMERKLLELGAPREKLYYNCYGVDCEAFVPGNPELAAPKVLTTSNFVEKKAPHLTILAFAKTFTKIPQARLRMIGDGPLLDPCKDLVAALRIEHAVSFLGRQPHSVIQREMRDARCFAQHSITAQDGNSEGTPNVILEASASGLPVVSTRHAGIPDVVVDGETGLLTEERDIDSMSDHFCTLLDQPCVAREMGLAARTRVERYFTMDFRIARLWSIMEACLGDTNNNVLPDPLDDEKCGNALVTSVGDHEGGADRG